VHLDRIWRIAIVVALLFPLGFVMGMPMPSGIRVLARTAPEFGPVGLGRERGHVRARVDRGPRHSASGGLQSGAAVGAGLYLLAMVSIARTSRRRP